MNSDHAQLIADSYPLIRRIARATLPGKYRDYADDVVQAVAVELWEKITTADNADENLDGWIVNRTKCRALDVIRKKGNSCEEQPEPHQAEQPTECDTCDPHVPATLTQREQEVVWRLADGAPEREIADELHTSQRTIHRTIDAIRKKLLQRDSRGRLFSLT